MIALALPHTLDEEVERAAKLASQYPKIHACSGHHFGRLLTYSDLEDFRERTSFYAEAGDAYCTMEHRNCDCGSTLMVLTEIFDMGAE